MNELLWCFKFDPDACIQCLGCEAACKMWRRTEDGIWWRRVLNFWHGSYPDVTCSAVSLSCQHCANPPCLDACPVSAIDKNPDGIVRVDPEKCIGCRACFEACPYSVPQFGSDGLMQKCDMCAGAAVTLPDQGHRPACVATCPTNALILTKTTADKKLQSEKDILSRLQQP